MMCLIVSDVFNC